MAIEPRRVCGFRKIGGIYLVGGGPTAPCGWLSAELHACALCSFQPPFARGVQGIPANYLLSLKERPPTEECQPSRCASCPVRQIANEAESEKRIPLIWIGRQYTPETFAAEAAALGISRRISNPPIWLKVGDWIFCAHLDGAGVDRPAVFQVFKLHRIEHCHGDQTTPQTELDEDFARGWTPVLLPENDPDHGGQDDSPSLPWPIDISGQK